MRRARIKALATVPVRRKNVVQEEAKEKTEKDTSKENEISQNIVQENKLLDKIENTAEVENIKVETEIAKKEEVKITEKEELEVAEKENGIEEQKVEKIKEEEPNTKINESIENKDVQNDQSIDVEKDVVNDMTKQIVEDIDEVKTCHNKQEKENIETLNEEKCTETLEKNNNETVYLEDRNKEIAEVKSTENEIVKKQNLTNKEKENFEKDVILEKETVSNESPEKKKSLQPNVNHQQEGSPLKSMSNRLCFMRPTPRLDGVSRIRRNSMCGSGQSASESEDDSRRTPIPVRVRNDSMSSVQNGKDTATPVNISKSAGSKRRACISASAKKLKDARQEFLLKYENKTPDKSKLKMYDLIYYNPVGSPMKKTNTGPRFVNTKLSSEDEKEAEEDEDDPGAMPVPQVKVGPNGQLIIDQQSLVIERTKSKVTIDRSKIIVADEYTNGGFYKKRKVRREWSKWETLKFYKALNSIGTDFLLMQNFFPKRTRQELKLKFKKEERINGPLVAKALSKYHEFDTEFLKKQLLIFEENEKKELEEKSNEKKSKSETKAKSGKRKHSRNVVAAIECFTDADDEGEGNGNDSENVVTTESKTESQTDVNKTSNAKTQDESSQNDDQTTSQRGRRLNKRQLTPTPMSGSEISSDSETEIYKPKPTRSGRVPKVRKLQAPDINTLDNQFMEQRINNNVNNNDNNSQNNKNNSNNETNNENECENVISERQTSVARTIDDIRSMIPDVNQIEPGSLVILTKEAVDQPGKNILQVYMVNASQDSGDQSITRINLAPELLATVTTRMTEVDMANS